jgi:hypothetical protein
MAPNISRGVAGFLRPCPLDFDFDDPVDDENEMTQFDGQLLVIFCAEIRRGSGQILLFRQAGTRTTPKTPIRPQ